MYSAKIIFFYDLKFSNKFIIECMNSFYTSKKEETENIKDLVPEQYFLAIYHNLLEKRIFSIKLFELFILNKRLLSKNIMRFFFK